MTKTPVDLPEVNPEWRPWPITERIDWILNPPDKLAEFKDLDEPVLTCSIAITLCEQPGQIPNCNPAGIMPQGEIEPWGWSPYYWLRVTPKGYVILKEGETGQRKPFFAFHSLIDSCFFICQVVYNRKIYSGDEYAEKWAGVITETQKARLSTLFKQNLGLIAEQMVTRDKTRRIQR